MAPAGSDGPVLLGADPQFSFNFDIGGVGGDIGSVILDGSQVIGTDYYLATSGTLTLTSGPDALAGTYNLETLGPGAELSELGSFVGDSLLFPLSDSQESPATYPGLPDTASGTLLDSYGLVFDANGVEINIWGNSAGNYSFDSSASANYIAGGTASGTATSPTVTSFIVSAPEPSAALLLAIMLLGVGIAGRRSFSRR